MHDEAKSRAELITELQILRQRVTELENMSHLLLTNGEDKPLSGEVNLHSYRNRLEKLAAERTAGLMKANEQLLQQIVEREWAEDALKKIKSRYELAVKAGKVV